MNTETFTYLLAHPQEISTHHLGELASVIEKYPYFQSARALQLKGLKNGQSFLYNDALKKAAAYTADRDILFGYITSEAFVQDDISKAILQHDKEWNDIEVEATNISEEISLAIDNQLKEELKKAEAILNPALFEKKKQEVLSLLENNQTLLNKQTKTAIETTIPETNEEVTPPMLSKEPLPFTKEDKHSFTQWLKLSKARPIEREIQPQVTNALSQQTNDTLTEVEKQKKFQLIEKFIQESPKISPVEKNSVAPPVEIPISEGPKSLMTETLAKVYLQQNNYEKAIQAYKILILKYPEKSGFFADQIRAIKKLTNKK